MEEALHQLPQGWFLVMISLTVKNKAQQKKTIIKKKEEEKRRRVLVVYTSGYSTLLPKRQMKAVQRSSLRAGNGSLATLIGPLIEALCLIIIERRDEAKVGEVNDRELRAWGCSGGLEIWFEFGKHVLLFPSS